MLQITTNRKTTRTTLGFILGLSLLPLLGGVTGCATNHCTQAKNEHYDDQATTSRVSSALADDRQHTYFEGVRVETFKDVVQLSGFVNTRDLKSRAGEVARDAAGRRDVHNNITVKE